MQTIQIVTVANGYVVQGLSPAGNVTFVAADIEVAFATARELLLSETPEVSQ